MNCSENKPPAKRLIFDISPFRTTVVLAENGRACEVYTEDSSERKLVGSIYKGVVQSILPGLSAAFVNIGQHKNAILHFCDIRVDRSKQGGSKFSPLSAGTDVSEVLRVGSEITVQISKEPTGTKGPKLTMGITLPGHTLVLIPGSNIVCMSKRFHSVQERSRVKGLLTEHLPEGYGVIARSESELMENEKILSDLDAIMARWKRIENELRVSRAPKLVWSEEDLLARAIRDLMRSDVDELVINSQEGYARVCTLLNASTPHLVEKVHLIPDEPDLIERFDLTKQFAVALSRRVWLKSGAYIVIDKTEALTSIDVNTGKNVGKTNAQATILETNLEAVEEIAHQIRLRNLGGIIIIDFIDMTSQENRDAVVDALKRAMSGDPARPVVYGMTKLGLVEVARRRSGKCLSELYTVPCGFCDGSGSTLSPETVALRLRKRLLALIADGNKLLFVLAYPTVIAVIRTLMEQELAMGRIDSDIQITYRSDVFMPPSDFDVKLHY